MMAETGEQMFITQSYRSKERQQELYNTAKGRVAPPGKSWHEKGLAIDIENWELAIPYLKKYDIVNGLPGDMGHFSRGEMNPEPTGCYKIDDKYNEYVRIADRISGSDINFLALLHAENDQWTPDRKHNKQYWKGGKTIRGKFLPAGYYNDWGFCGTSDYYYWDIVSDPKFQDPEWQIQKCWDLYKGGTTFYGKNNIWKTKRNFTCE